MNVTKIIELDLAEKGAQIQIGPSAMEGDCGSRSLTFRLMQSGQPWIVPEGVRVSVAFRTQNGYSGEYDQMPDGTEAFSIEENTVTVRLIEQITAEAGMVRLILVLRDDALCQLSAFPVLLEVEEGIDGAEELPRQFYRVRDLAEVNAELERIAAMAEAVDTAANVKASQEARAAAEEAKLAALSVDAEQLGNAIAAKGDDVYVEDGKLYLLSNGSVIGEGVEIPAGSGGGLAFDSGYVDEQNLMHLTLEGKDIEGFVPFALPAGGGGEASVMKLTSSLLTREFAILEKDESCEIPYSWSSTVDGEPTGPGIAEWTVNGSRVALVAVEQGDGVFDVRPYLASGAENTVVLKVTDARTTYRTLTYTITVRSFGLSWNLGETAVHDGALSVRLTPSGSGEKTLKLAVDGTVISETTVTTTGRTTTVTVPAQTHGAHTVTAWVEANVEGETLPTEPLTHVGVWLSEGVVTPVVGVLTPELQVGQYGTAAIRYFVVDPAAETARVELGVDGSAVNVLESVNRDVQLWAYKATDKGDHQLTITCGDSVGTVALTVTDLGYEIRPVTAGLELDLDPAGHSNAEAGRANFGYTDGSGANHPLTFSENFDWVNGGFQTDEDGVTAFVIKRGTYVTLDRGLFDSECRDTGKTLKLIFKSENVRNYDATLMSCKSGNVGLVVQAQTATVSTQLETMNVQYCEGKKVELGLNIQSENEDSLAWLDLKAIQSCPPVKYGDTDSWAQSNPVPLTIGSEEADIRLYRMKLWGNSHNLYERLDEHIACAGSPEEMVERYERNDIYNSDGSISLTALAKKNPKLRVIHIRAPRMTTGKEDEVVCDIEILYEAGGEKHHLIIYNAVIKAQGTSSLEYILAALNLDADLAADGCVITNGLGETITEYAMTDNSIPVSYFNLKANVASSESTNNVELADEYNLWNPYVCAPKAADSRVRDTIEGHPCAAFFTSTADAAIEVGARTVQPGETILYFVGDMNNSKKNFAVFGQDNSVYPKQCCVEVMNNTELPCRFKENISDDETWKDGNFEFRFPKSPTDEMKQAFMAMQRWVVSTDRSAATGAAFDVPVTYDGVTYAGDTAEYRAAKFRAEFADHFVPEAMDFHYLFTDQHCMTDNRAKNLFMCYEYIEALDDYRWSVRCDYDNDTGLGNDNSGGLTFTYGLEDTDMVGDSWVFNAHDSVLWCNIRDLRSEELRSLHTSLSGKGAWDAERIAAKFRQYQSAVPEALRAEDMDNKYFKPWLLKDAAAYASKCLGTKEDQRDQFLPYQEVYKGSQYIDVSNRSDAISMRVTVEKAENGNITLTAFSDMYLVVMYGNGGRVMKRVKRNTPTLIECPTDSLGDTETYIFMASNLTAISSLAGMKPKFVLATTAKRLQELIVGSGETGYVNLNLNQIGVGNNQMLRLLDLRGTPNLVTALDLSALTSLERFLASGSGITGVSFAKGAPLTEVRLPAVSSLVALELKKLETFLMDASKLTLIRVEDCPGIDTYSVCQAATGLERGRLTGVDWNTEDASTIMRLTGLTGCDAQGKPADKFVLTGAAHVASITQLQIDAIRAAFEELELSYDEVVESVTVQFANYDGTVWPEATQVIPKGGDAVNPITAGLIATPERPSDVEHHYRYANWDKGFANVTEDTVITAVFTAYDRYYRVTHWLDDAESAKQQEVTVPAHSSVEYQGEDPEKEGHLWIGWDADTGDVVSDMDVHAAFIAPVMPDSMPEKFEYLYSNDPADDSALTLEQFLGVLVSGEARTFFQLGDRIKIKCDTENFADSEIVLELRSFKHFMSAEREGEWAGPYFGMVGKMNAEHRMGATDTNVGGFPATEMMTFLNETVYPGLPRSFRAMIERIEVLSSAGGTKADIVSAETYLTLESSVEIGFGAAAVPYVNEVAEGADEVTFACYVNGASRIRKTYNGAGTAGHWWTRSPNSGNATAYVASNVNGNWAAYSASYATGVSFGFCLRPCMPGGEG